MLPPPDPTGDEAYEAAASSYEEPVYEETPAGQNYGGPTQQPANALYDAPPQAGYEAEPREGRRQQGRTGRRLGGGRRRPNGANRRRGMKGRGRSLLHVTPIYSDQLFLA